MNEEREEDTLIYFFQCCLCKYFFYISISGLNKKYSYFIIVDLYIVYNF